VAWENINTHKVYARSTTDKGSTWSGIYEFSHGTDYLSKPTVGYNYGCLLLCQCQAPGGEVRIVESYEFSPSMADIGAGTAPSLLEYGVSYYPLALSTKGAAVPYAINPIVLPEVQYISGNITENTEWSGIVNVLGTVTVNAGVTLTITPGTTIFFNGGSSLYVNGTLNAAGNSSQRITFDRNGVSGTWGGIRFNSGSSGTVSYCDIKHAVYGIYCTGASPTISNNTITNCSADGIYLYNAAPSIKWNTISNNMGSGVYSHGSPSYVYLYRNTITGNQGAGINAYDSDLWLSQPGGSGYNAIRQNNQGITAAYNSCVYLVGMGGPNSAYNCVHNNTGLEVTAAYNSTVQAPKTFWNRPSPYTPWPSDYSLYYSTFTYSNPLSSDPNPGCPSLPQNLMVAGTSSELTDSPMQKTSVESSSTAASEEDDLLPVVQLEIEGKYTEAIAQATLLWTNELQQAASTSQKEIVKRQARKWRILTCLASCYRAAGRKDFVDFLNKEIRPKLSIYDELYAATLELEGRSLVNEGKYKKAIENWDILKIRFAKKASVHSYALYNLAYTYYDVLGDKAKAGEYFEELKAKYPDDEMTWHCRVLFGETDSLNYHKGAALQKEAFAEAYLPEEFGISQNYPNPFNPATTICYQLPGAGTRYIVSLKVYDLLGREVARLVDGVKEAGYYTATFDGSRLASGIYFTRFVVQPENETRPFVQVKKMLLMK
jgi:parallel beta-helix repeat protein